MTLESVKRQEANAKQRKQPAKTAEFSLVKVKNSRGGDATWGWIASLSIRPTVTLLEQAYDNVARYGLSRVCKLLQCLTWKQ